MYTKYSYEFRRWPTISMVDTIFSILNTNFSWDVWIKTGWFVEGRHGFTKMSPTTYWLHIGNPQEKFCNFNLSFVIVWQTWVCFMSSFPLGTAGLSSIWSCGAADCVIWYTALRGMLNLGGALGAETDEKDQTSRSDRCENKTTGVVHHGTQTSLFFWLRSFQPGYRSKNEMVYKRLKTEQNSQCCTSSPQQPYRRSSLWALPWQRMEQWSQEPFPRCTGRRCRKECHQQPHLQHSTDIFRGGLRKSKLVVPLL